jgi:hypothetical protein
MAHNVALVVGIAVGVALLCTGGALALGLRMRRKIFAGPARDAWEFKRLDLNRADQRHVQWATMRHRPVRLPRLASAQLVYSRYVQYTAEHSPFHRWWFLVMFSGIWVAVGTVQIADAFTETQGRVFHLILGGLFAVLALAYPFLITRSLTRGPLQMKRLRRDVRDRYPNDW